MEPNYDDSNLDFGFAFNVANFSDRVLVIEIEHDYEVDVKGIHISSAILAAKSPVFFNLFSNGRNEPSESIRIHSSEEVAMMELLKFMYTNTVSSTTTTYSLIDLLMVAEKFEVSSCIEYCNQLLLKLPWTCESALLYLDLPSSVVMGDGIEPLAEAAKMYIADLYKDFTKSEEEIMELPLAGIEAVLSSDDLQVRSEDTLCGL